MTLINEVTSSRRGYVFLRPGPKNSIHFYLVLLEHLLTLATKPWESRSHMVRQSGQQLQMGSQWTAGMNIQAQKEEPFEMTPTTANIWLQPMRDPEQEP